MPPPEPFLGGLFDPTDGLLVFAVGLLIGGLAIHVGSRVANDARNYSYAVLTALIGALAWAALGWIPLLGTALALVAWVAVIKWRYAGGWLRAGAVGVAAWATAVVVVAALALVGVGSLSAIGVPGA